MDRFRNRPKLFAMIEDDRLFEKTAHIQGFDPTLTTFVRRYKPGSISGYPLPQVIFEIAVSGQLR